MKKLEVGRFVRIRFDDVGVIDGLITEFDGFRGRVYCIVDRDIDKFEKSQVVEVGPYLNVPKF